MSKKPAGKKPAHTGGFGGLGNMTFPGKPGGGGPPPKHKHPKPHHHHTGGFGGLGNKKFPGGSQGKGGSGGGGGKPRTMPGGAIGPKHHPGKHPKRHLAGSSLGGWWITGGNDAADNCAAVAAANSLLLSSGLRTSDAELLRLHDRAGPLSIPEALAALGEMAGRDSNPQFPSLTVYGLLTERGARPPQLPAISTDQPNGLVIGLATPHGPHAALWTGVGLVTWGGLIPWPDDWLAEEAWAVTW